MQSFDAYNADPLYWRGQIVIFLFAMLVVFATAGPRSAWRLPWRGKAVSEPGGH